MSARPFAPDLAVALRVARLASSVGGVFTDQIASSLTDDHVLPRAAVERSIATFGLRGPREAMLLALATATGLAEPPISGFRVGAVGLERDTGDLILGANIEFPGDELRSTIHGEGFVFARAFARDTSIAVLATREARPCGHCRQFIVEFASAPDLDLIDPSGHTLTMAALLPWPFIPADLGKPGIATDPNRWPALSVAPDRLPPDVTETLVRAGRRAYAPYSQCPSAVALRLADGRLVAGACIESVAFNPSIGPLQAAIVEALALGAAFADIRSATLAVVAGGPVDVTNETRALLGVVAPDAPLSVTTWA